ncbi:hypothetical protein [Neorhizobium galegae]|uniref:hypothetical protein n=1 Tax=Neorhizobium galegae TaxID=399 RepID=UPI0027D770ED|nr:hypothetical protein [Neorhizobium galegae]
MSAAEALKGYADLVDPKWKGKIAMTSLRIISGTGQALSAALRDGVIDEKWLTALAA